MPASERKKPRRDGFFRPILGRKRDVTMQKAMRPGITVYEMPVFRNKIRRGTLKITLLSYTNGDLAIYTDYVKKPWEKSEPFVQHI